MRLEDYDSNGRLDGEIGGVDGDATPFLAGSIGKFWSISQREARLIGRRCQKWIEERKSFPTVSKS